MNTTIQEVLVSTSIPRDTTPLHQALAWQTAIFKIQAVIAIVFFIIFSIVFIKVFKPSGLMYLAIPLVLGMLGIFLFVQYKSAYKGIAEKAKIFEQGDIVTAKVINHEKKKILNDNTRLNNGNINYFYILNLELPSKETITLSSVHQKIFELAPINAELIGLHHNEEYLFGEDNLCKFVKE